MALLNVDSGERLIVKTPLNPPELELPTVTTLWMGANWMEREVYDMYGIVFAGHPDLRRILMPDEFTAYPLRKDYPPQGIWRAAQFPGDHAFGELAEGQTRRLGWRVGLD